MKSENHKILVVDDEESIREFVCLFLREYGHTVDEADNGNEALRRCAAERYAMVFSDLMMPGMSGPELVRSIRALDPGVFIVLMSGMSPDDSLVQSGLVNADALLLKPFNAGQLIRIVSIGLETAKAVPIALKG